MKNKFLLLLIAAATLLAHTAAAQPLINITDPTDGTGIAYKARARVISAAAVLTRQDHTILANATSAGFTITLPPAGTNQTNQVYVIHKNDSTANIVTIDPNGSETVDGNTTIALSSPNQTVILQSAQSGWHILARNDVPRVITKAATATMTANELYGHTIINTGASGAIVLTLPAPQPGMRFFVYLTAAQDVDLNAADSTQILVATNATGDALSSDATIGSRIELVALSSTTWGVVSSSGTWTDVN